MYEEVTFKAEIAGLLPDNLNTDAHKNACWLVYCNAQSPDNNRLVAGRLPLTRPEFRRRSTAAVRLAT